MKTKIKFINHACFQIIRENSSILVDPWFNGKVFNNSWSLLQETNLDDIDLSNLTHIFISHEHPDHLNWSTLKQIKERTKQKIHVYMPRRRNHNVKENMKKLGYLFVEVDPYQIYKIKKYDFSFCFLKRNYDSAILFDVDEKIILNKNDCEFPIEQLQQFKQGLFKNREIDILFNQFSLAGYYGNQEETQKLEEAKENHIEDLLTTHKILKPKLTVPFASFITFSRDENKYLNEYIVSLKKLIDQNSSLSMFVPWYMEDISFECSREKSIENSEKWENTFKREIAKKPDSLPIVDEQELKISYTVLRKDSDIIRQKFDVEASVPREDILLFVQDLDRYCKFSFVKDSISFMSAQDIKEKPIGIVSSYDLNSFFKLPWGADTMNITSCFTILQKEQWRKMLVFRDMCYYR